MSRVFFSKRWLYCHTQELGDSDAGTGSPCGMNKKSKSLLPEATVLLECVGDHSITPSSPTPKSSSLIVRVGTFYEPQGIKTLSKYVQHLCKSESIYEPAETKLNNAASDAYSPAFHLGP